MKNTPRKRAKLFAEQDGRCHWCNQPMLPSWTYRKGVRVPDNLATLEHLDSRLSKERGKHPGERRVVLACNVCNEARNKQEQAQLSIEELHARSQQHSSKQHRWLSDQGLGNRQGSLT